MDAYQRHSSHARVISDDGLKVCANREVHFVPNASTSTIMDGKLLELWLNSKTSGEWGAFSPQAETLRALLQGTRSTGDAARDLVSDASLEPWGPESDRAWRAWQLLLSAAVELPRYHQTLVELFHSIHATPPVCPAEGSVNRLMQGLWADWRDEFDRLKTIRHLCQKHDAEPVIQMTGRERSITFAAFSAKLVNQGAAAFVDNIGGFAFFELRDVLESDRDRYVQGVLFDEETTSPSRVRSTDLEVACQWIIHGGRAILEMSNSRLEGFEAGIREPTDFWTGAPGLSEGRWRLWSDRLELCLREKGLEESAREAIRQAVGKLNA